MQSFWNNNPNQLWVLCYVNKHKCIELQVVKDTNQAGAAKATRNFFVEDVSAKDIGLKQQNNLLNEEIGLTPTITSPVTRSQLK